MFFIHTNVLVQNTVGMWGTSWAAWPTSYPKSHRMTGCSDTNIPGAFPPLCLTADQLSNFFYHFTTICLFFGLVCCLTGLGKQSGIISRSGSAAEAEGVELVKQCGDGAAVLGWDGAAQTPPGHAEAACYKCSSLLHGFNTNLYQVLPLATCRAVLHLGSGSEAEGEDRMGPETTE